MTDREAFERLLSPATIGGLTLRNRVVLPGMDMNHCEDGVITADEIAHYAARAAGGCGLLITGAAAVAWPRGATSRKQPALSDDRFLPGLTHLADAIHVNGGRLCVQLVHHGKVASVDTAEGRPQLVPSAPPTRMDLGALTDNPMHELIKPAAATQGKPATYQLATADDIAWVVAAFADAAGRVEAAGADAVEIHGAHGYLINTFLSRAHNQRTDEYGGPLENRARILVEVIEAVRANVGEGFPILVRLNGCEYGLDDGITIDETVATAQIAESAGADAVHISAQAANPFRDFTLGPLPAEIGQYREMAAAVKRGVSIPVIAVGRLLPELAEEMLRAGDCDFVAMGRQQLADPRLVEKLASGRRASVRPCINCYVCVEQNFFDAPPVCAVNPALGNEAAANLHSAEQPRHIVVVGAGPAGLETARIANERGHRVTILEANESIGGSTWFATLTASANAQLVDWLANEVGAADIPIHLGEPAAAEQIMALAPDAVVIATGAANQPMAVPGADLPHVHQGARLRDRVTELAQAPTDAAPRNIVVVGGNMIGVSIAQFVRSLGHTVTVLEPAPHLAVAMAMPRRWTAVLTAGQAGIVLERGATVTAITPTMVHHRATDSQADNAVDRVIEDVDDVLVTIAPHDLAEPAFAAELRAAGVEIHVVGDAGGVGYLLGAMHGAHAIATAL